jgi:hypothetical protein
LTPGDDVLSRTATACPACRSAETEIFFAMQQLPVHGQAVHATRDAALELTRGDQVLAVCHACSFVFNTAFDPGLLDYSGAHEESQAFSPAFRAFASELARGWTERYDLVGELVVEIGAGKGDFMKLLAEAGVGRAHGIDPGIDLERLPEGGQVTGERAYYSPSELSRAAVAIACRHTLEHIPNSTEFLADVVAGLDPARCRALLFEVPDLTRVLTEAAFWDLQYEHCSSFTAGALKALFERHGLEVLDLRLVYGGQYLIIEADPTPGTPDAGALRRTRAGRRGRSPVPCLRGSRQQEARALVRLVRCTARGRAGGGRLGRRREGPGLLEQPPRGRRAPRRRHQRRASRSLARRRRGAHRGAGATDGRSTRHGAADERGLPG